MMELKELENRILTDLNHYVATHFLTIRDPCLGRDPYFKNPWSNVHHSSMLLVINITVAGGHMSYAHSP